MKAIIVTQSKNEAVQLHRLIGDNEWERSLEGFYGQGSHQDLSKVWLWVYDEGELSGSSGAWTLESTVKRNEGYRIYTILGFEKAMKK